MGRGQVVSSSLVRVTGADGSVEDIAGDKVIIATGLIHAESALPACGS